MSPRSCLYYLWFSSYKTHKNYHGLIISISITIHPVTLIRLLYTLASFVSLAHDYTHLHKTQSSRPKISRGIVLEGS